VAKEYNYGVFGALSNKPGFVQTSTIFNKIQVKALKSGFEKC
jgi:hypothetical protein